MKGWADVKMRRCENARMWRCEDVKMRRFEDVGEDVEMNRCEMMWTWEDVNLWVRMWRWENVKMWGCKDESVWKGRDVKMKKCEDVKMRMCEEEQMWRWEIVRMGENVRMWGREVVKMWGCQNDKMWGCENVRMKGCGGVPLEHAAARVCREAGARVTMHTRLANLNIPAVQRVDDRTLEVIANGLPLWHGSQLAIDTTLVSPLTAAAEPRRRGGRYAAAALHTARQNKQRTYPELLGSARCRLVVLGMEVGGRWSQESADFLRLLAQHKARAVPAPLQQATVTSLISRWSAILAHAGMHAFAASLLSLPADGLAKGACLPNFQPPPPIQVDSRGGEGAPWISPLDFCPGL